MSDTSLISYAIHTKWLLRTAEWSFFFLREINVRERECVLFCHKQQDTRNIEPIQKTKANLHSIFRYFSFHAFNQIGKSREHVSIFRIYILISTRECIVSSHQRETVQSRNTNIIKMTLEYIFLFFFVRCNYSHHVLSIKLVRSIRCQCFDSCVSLSSLVVVRWSVHPVESMK